MSKDLLFMLRSIRVLGTSNSAFSLVKRAVFFFALEAVALDGVALDDVASDDVTLDDVASDDVTSDDVASHDVASHDMASEGVAILSNVPFSAKLLLFSDAKASGGSVPCGSSLILYKLDSLLSYTLSLYSEDVTILISIGISSVWLPWFVYPGRGVNSTAEYSYFREIN